MNLGRQGSLAAPGFVAISLLLGIVRTARSWTVAALPLLVGAAALGVVLTLYGWGLFERLGSMDQSAGARFPV